AVIDALVIQGETQGRACLPGHAHVPVFRHVEVAALGATRSLRGALARPASPAPSPALAIRGALIADPTAPPAPPKPDTLAMGFSKAGAMVMPGMTFTGGFIRPIGMGFTKPGE
ncbi:MAG: hypothetical protein ACK4YX_07290, partial [Rhabdaerophilum calidifontis]